MLRIRRWAEAHRGRLKPTPPVAYTLVCGGELQLAVLVAALILLGQLMPLNGQTITDTERDVALKRLESSRKAFLETIQGLSDAQWKFKPAPERWSAGECAEHIVLTEESYLRTFTRLLESPATPDKKAELSDADLLKLYTDRSQKRTAPEAIQPKGRFATRQELVAHFNGLRDKVIAVARETRLPLRSHVSAAAAGGRLMDAYQWFLRFAGHCERHTDQIREVMADPNYPRQ